MQLVFALSYGGPRRDRRRRAPARCATPSSGRLEPEALDEKTFAALPLRARAARPRPADPHRRRAAHLELPALADRLRRALLSRRAVARLRPSAELEALARRLPAAASAASGCTSAQVRARRRRTVKRLALLGSTGQRSASRRSRSSAAFPERFRGDGARRRPQRRRSSPSRCGSFRPELRLGGRRRRRGGAARASRRASAARSRRRRGPRRGARAPDADLVVAALVGAVGLAPDARGDPRRARRRARQQGSAGDGRRARAARGARARGVAAAAGRQRAQRDLPGARRRSAASTWRALVLTASGGPFRTWRAEQIARATRRRGAARIRTGRWGRRSRSTRPRSMNKGLEVIEARWLFDVAARARRRGGASAVDRALAGRVRATARCWRSSALPDMRVPIACALAWPERLPLDVRAARSRGGRAGSTSSRRTRSASRASRSPARALRRREAAPAVLNAANEVAVAAFLAGAHRVPRHRGGERARCSTTIWRCTRAKPSLSSRTCSPPTPGRASRARAALAEGVA